MVSLQPSLGPRNPRIFLFWDKLIVSVVPDGTGRSLLEMGQLVDVDRSLKGELGFPITGPVDPGTPFARVFQGQGTSCGLRWRSKSCARSRCSPNSPTAR